jgi:hypothetical protein
MNRTKILLSPEIVLRQLGAPRGLVVCSVGFDSSGLIVLHVEGDSVPPNAPECALVIRRHEARLEPTKTNVVAISSWPPLDGEEWKPKSQL